MNPNISIIVPIYNTEKYLRHCIDSILNQSFTDFELLLIDDGSKDRSGFICDEYAKKDSRIHVCHKKNAGIASARNTGLDLSHCDWIAYIDGDDWVEPSYLEELYTAATNNDADIAICGFRFAFDDGHYSYQSPCVWEDNKEYSMSQYISSIWTSAWGSIQKRSLYTTNGVRSPDGIGYCEDFHLMVRLCYFANKIISIDRPLYNYRQHAASIVHSLCEKTWHDEIKVYKNIIDFFDINDVYETYKKPMAWRTLKAAQDMTLNPAYFEDFKNYNPDKKDYIWKCPFIGFKIKLLSWLITHRLETVAATINRLRKILG